MENYLTAGIGFSRLVRLVRRNRVSFHPKYIFRLLFLAQSSVWTDIFTYLERKRFGKQIAATPVPEDPIFIIGHWRAGTTLLHQLMNLDPNLAAPTLFQVAEPGCFISFYQYYRPVFSLLMPKTRPMDNVRIGINEPQEDEYAIYRITDFSPIEHMVFPKGPGYFITDTPSFLPQGEVEKKKWEEQLAGFFRKLTFFHGKTIISKNPFNSLRIQELNRMFPKARFIHLSRHPFDVIPSSIHMWKIVQHQNKLNRKSLYPGVPEVTEGLDRILTAIRRDLPLIPENRVYNMKFEKLESDPVSEIRKLYSWFNLPFDINLSQEMENFTGELKGYRKNKFFLSDEDKQYIRERLDHHMQFYGYF
ncbi:MAG: sulfotransferase [Bacteroidetes bacterium]|nr:sulfotransferase [Bacteroidota bacterium]